MIHINSVKIYGYNSVLDFFFFFLKYRKVQKNATTPNNSYKNRQKSANTPTLRKKCYYVFLDVKL